MPGRIATALYQLNSRYDGKTGGTLSIERNKYPVQGLDEAFLREDRGCIYDSIVVNAAHNNEHVERCTWTYQSANQRDIR